MLSVTVLALLPWWAALLVVLIASLRHRFFVEGVLVGYCFDVWFGAPIGLFHGYYGVLSVILLLLLVEVFVRVSGFKQGEGV